MQISCTTNENEPHPRIPSTSETTHLGARLRWFGEAIDSERFFIPGPLVWRIVLELSKKDANFDYLWYPERNRLPSWLVLSTIGNRKSQSDTKTRVKGLTWQISWSKMKGDGQSKWGIVLIKIWMYVELQPMPPFGSRSHPPTAINILLLVQVLARWFQVSEQPGLAHVYQVSTIHLLCHNSGIPSGAISKESDACMKPLMDERPHYIIPGEST